jgi:hypothetical protein
VTDAPLDAPPLPSAQTPFAPPPPRRRLALAAGLLVVVVVVVGLVVVFTRHTGSSAASSATPAAAADGYYAALHRQDARAAFNLLCPQQQAEGYPAYAANVAQDSQTGTGIRSWERTGAVQTQGNEAIVPGQLVLDNGQATAIQVLLVQASGGWRVCTSNLGGILPGPGGSGSGASPSPSTSGGVST